MIESKSVYGSLSEETIMSMENDLRAYLLQTISRNQGKLTDEEMESIANCYHYFCEFHNPITAYNYTLFTYLSAG